MVDGGGSGGGDVPWPWSVKIMPVFTQGLLRRKVRIIYPGHTINQKYQPGLITIYVTEDNRIDDIHIEPDSIQNLMSMDERLKENGPGDDPIPFPSLALSLKNGLILIKELLGRKVLIVYPDDDPESEPERITIYVTEDNRIDDIQIEPDEPTE